jgi:hypothetical protein
MATYLIIPLQLRCTSFIHFYPQSVATLVIAPRQNCDIIAPSGQHRKHPYTALSSRHGDWCTSSTKLHHSLELEAPFLHTHPATGESQTAMSLRIGAEPSDNDLTFLVPRRPSESPLPEASCVNTADAGNCIFHLEGNCPKLHTSINTAHFAEGAPITFVRCCGGRSQRIPSQLQISPRQKARAWAHLRKACCCLGTHPPTLALGDHPLNFIHNRPRQN